MGPDEYTRALGHDRLVDGERTLPKKKTLWSGIKNIFHQRHRTPSRLELSKSQLARTTCALTIINLQLNRKAKKMRKLCLITHMESLMCEAQPSLSNLNG